MGTIVHTSILFIAQEFPGTHRKHREAMRAMPGEIAKQAIAHIKFTRSV
jgi:hypothetical protein